jgi:hypothetical protein
MAYENVIFKLSFLNGAVGECHFSIAVLDTCLPFSLIEGTVGPKHLTVAISLVVNVISFVDVS